MDDYLREGLEQLEDLDGATAPTFRRIFVSGDDPEARRDAATLARALGDRGETVNHLDAAELIAIGSAGGPGRVALDTTGLALLDGARCPVVVAPGGYAATATTALDRIAVGVDGSREAAVALTTAARLAHAHDAELHLVAVAEPSFDLDGKARPVDPRELERLARHLAHALDDLPGLRVETDLREGVADQILLGIADRAHLLVLGSRAGYGDAGRVRLGGVTSRVLAGAPCPVLILPAP